MSPWVWQIPVCRDVSFELRGKIRSHLCSLTRLFWVALVCRLCCGCLHAMCSLKLSFLPSHSDEITKVKTFLSKCKLTTRTYLSFNDHVTAIKTHTQFILLVCPALCLYHSVIPITPTMLCSFLTSPHFHFIPVMLFSFCLCCVLCLMCPWHPFSLCVTCHLSLHSPQPNINIMDMSDHVSCFSVLSILCLDSSLLTVSCMVSTDALLHCSCTKLLFLLRSIVFQS